MNRRYACSLRGVCEVDPYGEYENEDNCREYCQGTDSREVVNIIYDYAPLATGLAPTDRTELIKRTLGVTLTDPVTTYVVLQGLDNDDYLALAVAPELTSYLLEHHNTTEELQALAYRAVTYNNVLLLKEVLRVTQDFLYLGNFLELGLQSADRDIVTTLVPTMWHVEARRPFTAAVKKSPPVLLSVLKEYPYLPPGLIDLLIVTQGMKVMDFPAVQEVVEGLDSFTFESFAHTIKDVQVLEYLLTSLLKNNPTYAPRRKFLEYAIQQRYAFIVHRARKVDVQSLRLTEKARKWLQEIGVL